MIPANTQTGTATSEKLPHNEDDVLDVPDVMRLLHLGRNSVYGLVSRHEIPFRRLGKQIRFSREALMRWLSSCSLQGAKERH